MEVAFLIFPWDTCKATQGYQRLLKFTQVKSKANPFVSVEGFG